LDGLGKTYGTDHKGLGATDNKSIAFELDLTWLRWIIIWYKAFPTLLLLEGHPKTTNSNTCESQFCGEYDVQSCIDDVFMIHCGEIAFNSLFDPYDNEESSLRREHNIPRLVADRTNEINNHGILDDNLGYGEIRPSSILTCIGLIQSLHYHHYQKSFAGRKIVDLGSGNGKVLFAACCLGGYIFEHAVGVEIVGELHDEAMGYLKIWDTEWDWLYCNGGDDEDGNGKCKKGLERAFEEGDKSAQPFRRRTNFTFLHQDFTQTRVDPKTKNMFSDSSIIIVHGTLFDSKLMSHVQKICEESDQGTYFIMVTKPLNRFSKEGNDTEDIGNVRVFETLCERELEMNWGKTTVFMQRRC